MPSEGHHSQNSQGQQNDSRLTDPQCLVSRIKASSVLIVLIEGYD